MDFDFVVAICVAAFVVAVWLYMAGEWGFVESVDERGFAMRTLLRSKRMIEWESLASSVQEFRSFLPRLVFRLRERRFLGLHNSFALLLRERPLDKSFVDHVRTRFKVMEVRGISDLMKR